MKSLKFIFSILLFSLSASFAFAQTTPTKTPQSSSNKEITSVIKVKGVTCKNDLQTIADNVEKLTGVASFKANKPGPTTSFQLKFNPALVSEKEIFAAIEATPGCENPNDRPYKVKQ